MYMFITDDMDLTNVDVRCMAEGMEEELGTYNVIPAGLCGSTEATATAPTTPTPPNSEGDK